MKLTAAKRNFIGVMILLSSCAPRISGTWNYVSVYDQNSGRQIPVASGDSMVLRKDGSFAYGLKQAGRNGNGFWRLADTLNGRSLVLRYLPQNNERSFHLDSFTSRQLVISEGSMVFSYRR